MAPTDDGPGLESATLATSPLLSAAALHEATMRSRQRQAERRVDPKVAAAKHKLAMNVVPPAAIKAIVRALSLGANKYGAYNWRGKVVHMTTYYDAALRHLLAWLEGEDRDPESGVSHLAHAAASLAVLLDALEHSQVVDDRPGRAAAPPIA